MAWDDASNLWWLKPRQDDFNPMQGIALGMNMVQQNREQALRMKQFALQQQTRNDMLEWRNKQMDQEIKDYQFKKDQAQLEMDDMITMGKVQSGEITNPDFRTPNGWKAFESWNATKSMMNARERMSRAEFDADLKFKESLADLINVSPMIGTKISNDYKANNGQATPEMIAELSHYYNTLVLPNKTKAMPGERVTVRRVRLPNGEFMDFRPEQSPFVKSKSREDFIRETAASLFEKNPGLLDIKEATQKATELWNSTSGTPTAGTATTISTKAEFDALPSGATYINAKDGKTYRKP